MKVKGEIGYVIWKDDVEVVFWLKVGCDKVDLVWIVVECWGEVIDCMKERVGVVFV